jgi:hypothetical protein
MTGVFVAQAEWIIAAPATVKLDLLTDDLAVAFHRCGEQVSNPITSTG